MGPTQNSKKAKTNSMLNAKSSASTNALSAAKKPGKAVLKVNCAPQPLSKTGVKKMTKVIVKFNCGFPNNLFIRGEDMPGLNWERGVVMKNVKADEWVWESDKPFAKGKFKVMLNDRVYETGDNHPIEYGKSATIIPKF